jgi:hypothetical protein
MVLVVSALPKGEVRRMPGRLYVCYVLSGYFSISQALPGSHFSPKADSDHVPSQRFIPADIGI